jgi:diguanylate cyclase (GGDEF)-like protein
MKTIFNILDKKRPESIWWLSVLIVVVICFAIILAERYVDLVPFLTLPVLLISWYGSSKSGVLLVVIATILLLVAKLSFDGFHPDYYSSVYNYLVVLFVCLFIAVIVTNFRKVHRVEEVAADTDSLTGASSSRRFYAELANEILRSERYGHKFSLAYIDVDNFKQINDKFGHSIGDRLLIQVYECLFKSLRATDVVARIGGDEFVCLLPESEQTEARSAILKAANHLKMTMRGHGWDVTFSIGVVTFEKLPEDVHEAVKMADELMYQVKGDKKNAVAYRVVRGDI